MIGFATFQITEEPQNKHIIGKFLGAVPESAFWPYSGIQHISLIK